MDLHQIEVLKKDPDVRTLENVLNWVLMTELTTSQQLKVVMIILDVTVPQIYNLTTDNIRSLVVKVLQSIVGVNGIMNKIQYTIRTEGNVETLKVYGTLLRDVFNDDLLWNISSSKTLEINEINKLLFKGRCFSIFQEMKTKLKIETTVFDGVDSYMSYLIHQLLKETNSDTFNKYLLSLISFNSNNITIFEEFFTETNWDILCKHHKAMKQFQKKTLASFIINSLAHRFEDIEKVGPVSNIVRPLFNKDILDIHFINSTLKYQNPFINGLIVSMLDELNLVQSIFQPSLKSWGDAVLIKNEPIVIQAFRTHFLVQMLYFSGSELCSNLLGSPIFIDCISNRLGSFSNTVKLFGIILADKACELCKKDKIFSMGDLEGYDYLLKDESYFTSRTDDSWNKVNEAIIEEPEVVEQIKELKITKSYKDSDDESDSDDDDPSIQSRVKIPAPIYIKELIRYLQIDTNHPQAYDMRKLALVNGPTLIRQKAQFGMELNTHAFSLLETFIGMSNHYEESDFEDLRLNGIISLLVSHPPSGLDIIKLLDSGDFSLQQRILILSSISLACRDIRGFKDEQVTKSYKEKEFATKMLPPQLHERYLQLDDTKMIEPQPLKSAFLSIQDDLMSDKSEDAKDQIAGGKILRISRKLTKAPQPKLLPRFRDYQNVISRNFYFPLIHLWHEVGKIDIGHYSPIFIGHYIKTLSLIIYCCNSQDMIREFLILVSEIPLSAEEIQIIEGIVTGLLVVCEVYDEQNLIINFGEIMINLHDKISKIWDYIIDNQLKSLCAGFLIRFTNILEKYQGNLLDKMNNLY
ncbi:putative DNA replication checkpoint protein Tel2p [[Candida] jaroonii]|uniref:DNA replication checkpoint protein Tel2p n=1 Tax=[Candida] jaroonii TaxID=467808 RepID=A0ACA9YCL2_9ASCO|nr:putative DNA replication checkpoint protein Tel2p [[Candida] jaroonii]